MANCDAMQENYEVHELSDTWTLWSHLPHDTDWSISSYQPIHSFKTVEEIILLNDIIPEKLIKNCMLFLMRDGIKPLWEDPANKAGGCFSYKVNNKVIKDAWTNLTYTLVGETITNDLKLNNIINGITLSPKKSFCILKIWTNTCDHQNASIIRQIDCIDSHGCLFKKHTSEY